MKILQQALTYDDISLVPQYSTTLHRADGILHTQVSKQYWIDTPILSAPMDTITEYQLAVVMAEMGGLGVIHRFGSIPWQVNQINKFYQTINPEFLKNNQSHEAVIAAAIGVTGDYLERAKELCLNDLNPVNLLVVDIAHGHHILMKQALEKLKKELPSRVDIIAGNICTPEAAQDLEKWGADALRINQGSGGLCSSRKEAGIGIPTATTADIICKVSTVPVIADGGIKNPGDIVKALALGASSVMIGTMLSGTAETPAPLFKGPDGILYKTYRGSASLESKLARGEVGRVEGVATQVPYKGNAKDIIKNIIDGIQSGLSYCGASNLHELKEKAVFVQVSSSGQIEAEPHLLFRR